MVKLLYIKYFAKFLNNKRLAFTLIEILIAIGIVVILSTAVILVLKPQDILKQSRDTRRLNDLSNFSRSLNYIIANEPNSYLGEPNTVYVSRPDPALSSNQTSTCPNMDLPLLPSSYNYYCVSAENLTKADGTGWIPVDFASQPIFKINQLPLDPKNDTNNYYVYIPNPQNKSYELDSNLESEKYRHLLIQDDGDNNFLYEIGTNLTLYPLSGIGQNMALKNEVGQIVKSDQGYAIYLAQAAFSQGQVAFFIASDQVSGDDYLFWDNTNKRLGIWTSSPGSKLSISGGVAIGSSYANQAAPVDGLIVQGNVGIGTTIPSYQFEVRGSRAGIYLDRIGNEGFILVSQNNLEGGGQIRSISGGGLRITNTMASTEWLRISASGNVGIGTTNPTYKLDVSGDMRTTGCLVYNGGTLGSCISEAELKNIIGLFQIEGALDKIIKLEPIRYSFKSDPTGQILVGLLAEKTEKILPELIQISSDGQKQIKYGELQWLQIEAIKDLKKEIEELKKEIEELKK